MDVSGIQQQIQKVAEQALKDQAKSGGMDRGAASAEDVEKLQAALNQPPAEASNAAQQTQGADKVQGADKAQGVEAPVKESPGAAILRGMHGVQSELQNKMKGVEAILSKGDLGSGEYLQVQRQLQEISLQHEMMSKAMSKTEENLNTLARQP